MHNNGQFNGSTSADDPPPLAPTWSVRETRKQFEQMGNNSHPPMSNSFSGDLRPYRGRYKQHVDQPGRQHLVEDGLDSFNAIKLNEGGWFYIR
jgi:hypothetical protein